MTQPEGARRPGRPSRMSREQIIDGALGLLMEREGLAGFSMSKLAHRIGASPMGLYTYFPDRAALLEAVADRVFGDCVMPEPSEDWGRSIQAWAQSLYSMFEGCPVAIDLLRRDGVVSPAWLKVWLPLVRILAARGLRGARLAFAATSIGNAVMGVVYIHCCQEPICNFQSLLSSVRPEGPDATFLKDIDAYYPMITGRRILKFTVENLLLGLDELIDDVDLLQGFAPSRAAGSPE